MEIRRDQLKIDPLKCTACNLCMEACSTKHHGKVDLELSRIRILKFEDQDLNYPVVCMACEDSPCIKVCPMNARKRLANGSVITDTEVCIGCRACLYICPAVSPRVNPHTGQTITCDMCEGDEMGPRCVIACKDYGALTLCQDDSLRVEKVRQHAGRFLKMYAR